MSFVQALEPKSTKHHGGLPSHRFQRKKCSWLFLTWISKLCSLLISLVGNYHVETQTDMAVHSASIGFPESVLVR